MTVADKRRYSNDLQHWLEGLPAAVSVHVGGVLATRAALRMVPLALAYAAGPSRTEVPLVPFLWCHIVAAARVRGSDRVPLPHLHAARTALRTARSLNGKRAKRRLPGLVKAEVAIATADGAALTWTVEKQPYAAMSASHQVMLASIRAVRAEDVGAAIFADAEAWDAGQDPWTLPLWRGASDPWTRQWQAAAPIFASHPGWGVLRALYEDASAGRSMNDALLATLASRPDEDWLEDQTDVLDWIAAEREKH